MHPNSERDLEPGFILARAMGFLTDSSDDLHQVRLLIDPGSEVSLISEEFVSRLKLYERDSVS